VSVRVLAVFAAAIAVVGLLAYGLAKKSTPTLALGERVPAPQLDTLAGGSTSSLADYRGNWVLVNVWASWCTPCRDEAPALERFYRANRRHDFTVLGVDSRDVSSDGLRFVREFGLTYPQVRDGDGSYAADLGTTGVPESFLVDPQGDLVLHRPGQVTSSYLTGDVLPIIRGVARG
jgi:cytochrome c biogenesis protein CcmG/thiol:disulfide interchange protein DsbE